MNTSRGFSLIELMIVVAVVGILAGVALPNYNEHVTRSKISEAVSRLSEMSAKLEQYYQDNRTYVGACTTGTVAPPPVNTNSFNFSCSSLSQTAYVVTAVGQNSMTGFEYRISNTGKSTFTVGAGWSGAPATCWILKKGGGC